jgi:hypothetical protein
MTSQRQGMSGSVTRARPKVGSVRVGKVVESTSLRRILPPATCLTRTIPTPDQALAAAAAAASTATLAAAAAAAGRRLPRIVVPAARSAQRSQTRGAFWGRGRGGVPPGPAFPGVPLCAFAGRAAHMPKRCSDRHVRERNSRPGHHKCTTSAWILHARCDCRPHASCRDRCERHSSDASHGVCEEGIRSGRRQPPHPDLFAINIAGWGIKRHDCEKNTRERVL